jgi:hypothetical protein
MLDIVLMSDYNSSAAMKCKSLSSNPAQCACFANEQAGMRKLQPHGLCFGSVTRISFVVFQMRGRVEKSVHCSTWNNAGDVAETGQGVALSWRKLFAFTSIDDIISSVYRFPGKKRQFFSIQFSDGYLLLYLNFSKVFSCIREIVPCFSCRPLVDMSLVNNKDSMKYVERSLYFFTAVLYSDLSSGLLSCVSGLSKRIVDLISAVMSQLSFFIREKYSIYRVFGAKGQFLTICCSICSTWNI